jgi:hypothetical protein
MERYQKLEKIGEGTYGMLLASLTFILLSFHRSLLIGRDEDRIRHDLGGVDDNRAIDGVPVEILDAYNLGYISCCDSLGGRGGRIESGRCDGRDGAGGDEDGTIGTDHGSGQYRDPALWRLCRNYPLPRPLSLHSRPTV